MSERIPQSVAKRVGFRAYLTSDGKTPATGKTIAITISKNGGAFGNPAAGATNATAISSGFYYFDLGTGDTDTQGPLLWRGAEGTIDDAGGVYEVVSAVNAGFTGIDDVPTNAELAAALAAADDAVLAAIAALNNLSSAGAQSAAAAALVAYGASTYAGGDTSGTTTLLSRLTSTRAGYLDNLSGGAVALASTILDAAGLRSALGLASANLDTQLGDLPTANENADALLGRNVAGGSSTGRTVKEALYFLRNKWTIAGGTLTVYATDDTTSAWTASVTQTAGDPVSASDPS